MAGVDRPGACRCPVCIIRRNDTAFHNIKQDLTHSSIASHNKGEITCIQCIVSQHPDHITG